MMWPLVGVVLLSGLSGAEDPSPKFSSYMDAAVSVEGFSGSVLVAKGGKVVFQKGYGFANAEHRVPNTPETKFRLGSITKQFTATAILILQDRGKLNVQDPINKYLADAPKTWDGVTIHHLLTHTSGVPSYTEDPEYGKSMAKPETVASMIARFQGKPLDFAPGETFHYSNSGYFLLGAIIEKVAGTSYEAFLKEAIFEPLGMKDTGYDHAETVLPGRASGYDRRGEDIVHAPYLDMNQPYAAGSLYSTVGDLFLWDRALDAGKPLTKDAMTAMFTPFKDKYAYGWFVETRDGRTRVGHGGGINGFTTDFQRYPEDDTCVVVLTNVQPANPGKVAQDLAAISFGQDVAAPAPRVVAKVDPKVYDAYVGTYEGAPKLVFAISREGDHLFVTVNGEEKVELYPESETSFFLKVADVQVAFETEDGTVAHLLVKQGGNTIKARRVAK